MIAEGGSNGVDCICGEICCSVQCIDEEEGCAQEEAGWLGDHGLETVGDCLADGKAFGCFFDDGAGDIGKCLALNLSSNTTLLRR